MKVEANRQRVMLEVADVDAQIARLTREGFHLPEDGEIAELTTRIDGARDDLVRAQIAAEDIDREYRRVESEVSGMSAREKKDSELLEAGGLPSKQLSELQHEVGGLRRRRSILEDDLLELMERQEATTAEQERASATVAQLESERADVQVRRDAARATVDGKLTDAQDRRDTFLADAPDELVAIYERQRAGGKVGAGLLRQQRCGACRMELDRGTMSSIARADADEVLRCEECGALLIRTAESGLPK
ncbi:zinc ribbon domain-containing protein [Gordonia sp. CPCC 205333]|uniref:zinc ribbon domain-containing protein n=1 Tax=Gordonia sp. CPCC 205333 TaxID=3140790 RepID=UPI003AF3D1CA